MGMADQSSGADGKRGHEGHRDFIPCISYIQFLNKSNALSGQLFTFSYSANQADRF
jgi:hypothetical protein